MTVSGAETAEARPDPRAEALGVGDIARLALAESPHAMTYHEIRTETRERLGHPLYDPLQERLKQALHQEHLMGRLERLAFRDNRWRLTPAGLRQLESDKPAYRGKCTDAVRSLAAAAVEYAAEQRPGATHARVELDTSFESGLAVSWVNSRLGLIQYDGSDLLHSEQVLLPDDHKRFGTLYLTVRRLELYLGDDERDDGHAEEILVFNYPKGDPDYGRRTYEGRQTPDMHTEIRRGRVPLGVLRQLTAELTGER